MKLLKKWHINQQKVLTHEPDHPSHGKVLSIIVVKNVDHNSFDNSTKTSRNKIALCNLYGISKEQDIDVSSPLSPCPHRKGNAGLQQTIQKAASPMGF